MLTSMLTSTTMPLLVCTRFPGNMQNSWQAGVQYNGTMVVLCQWFFIKFKLVFKGLFLLDIQFP